MQYFLLRRQEASSLERSAHGSRVHAVNSKTTNSVSISENFYVFFFSVAVTSGGRCHSLLVQRPTCKGVIQLDSQDRHGKKWEKRTLRSTWVLMPRAAYAYHPTSIPLSGSSGPWGVRWVILGSRWIFFGGLRLSAYTNAPQHREDTPSCII